MTGRLEDGCRIDCLGLVLAFVLLAVAIVSVLVTVLAPAGAHTVPHPCRTASPPHALACLRPGPPAVMG